MKLVTDITSQCRCLGELQHLATTVAPTSKGQEGGSEDKEKGGWKVHAELGQVLVGSRPGRESNQERILVDLTGVGVQDAALAEIVWAKHSKHDAASRATC